MTFVISLTLFWVSAGAVNNADCLIELKQPPVVDGDLNEWKDVPFITCGANLPCEATDAAVIWRGWDKNNFYFAARVFDEVLISGGDRIDLYFDFRPKSQIGRYPYEKGVWHIRVLPKVGNGSQPTIQVLDETGRPNQGKATEVQYAMKLSDQGWNVEVAIPWRTLETDPTTEGSINGTFSIADSDDYNNMPAVLLGTTPPDIRNNPNTDPITFETLFLHESPIHIPGFEIYLSEAVWNGEAVIRLRACCFDPQYFSTELIVGLQGTNHVEKILFPTDSLAGRFRVVDRCFPLSEIQPVEGVVKVSIATPHSKPVVEALHTPIYTEREKIAAIVPILSNVDSDPYKLLAAYYRALAVEASAEMSIDKDSAKIRQRQLRSQTDPKYWESVIDIFTRWSLRASHHDIPSWLLDYHRVWRSADGNLSAFKVTSPSSPRPPNGYPLVVEFPFGDINNERIRTYFDLLALENGTLEHTRGEAISIKLNGRGFVENTGASDLLSEEEYRFALGEMKSRYSIDPTKITFKGHSSGSSNALRYAVEYPRDFTFLDLRGGFFEGDFWRKLSDEKESALLNQLYSSTHHLEVLRGKRVRLVVGEYDIVPRASSKHLAETLQATGGESEFIELAGIGHDFAYPTFIPEESISTDGTTLSGGRLEGRFSGQAVQPQGVLQFGDPWSLEVHNDGSAVTCASRNISDLEVNGSLLNGNSLILDSQKIDQALLQGGLLRLKRPSDRAPWRRDEDFANRVEKSWSQPGPALDIRNKLLKIVYGTKNDQVRPILQERAEAIVRSFTGLGSFQEPNFHCQIVADTMVTPDDIRNTSLWLLGNAEENLLTERFAHELGLARIPHGFQVGNRSFTGKLLASILRPSGRDQYILFQMATQPSAYRGPALAGWQYDFTVIDCAKPFTPAVAWGFFDQNWQISPALVFSTDAP